MADLRSANSHSSMFGQTCCLVDLNMCSRSLAEGTETELLLRPDLFLFVFNFEAEVVKFSPDVEKLTL
jgi:hypothetical protein